MYVLKCIEYVKQIFKPSSSSLQSMTIEKQARLFREQLFIKRIYLNIHPCRNKSIAEINPLQK